MDAGVESPLDVLSRAATMLQESQQQEDATVGKSAKQLPTAKWKRDRRTRPDYMRKSEPKNADRSDSHELNGVNGFATDKSSSSSTSSLASASPASPTSSVITKTNGVDAPLDMTTTPRQRGLPPSYSQAISDPSFRSTYTNSRPNTNGREELPSGISMCDPIIDEHFRRSLGKDYNTVFNNNAKENPLKSKTPSPPTQSSPTATVAPVLVEAPKPKEKSPPTTPIPPVTSVVEMMDSSGMSVDDHFAKALGDTWAKLNKKDSNPSDNANVNTVTSSSPEVIST
ncbi:MAP7 domain-containing protein 1 isoform X2 [Atheta coriaria]|uniref:MAP7 domain-containing protein 1 isoform X2 n=1 Tax=Dalotia coriaria TaxID=877792 RepID=UPI0031F343D6